MSIIILSLDHSKLIENSFVVNWSNKDKIPKIEIAFYSQYILEGWRLKYRIVIADFFT